MLNYYENEFFKIKIYNKNKFKIDIDDNENIIIHRTGGWANDIEINIRYKTLFLDEIIKVSSSNKNTQKIKLNETNKDINVKLHYENDKYKIFYISEEFNDIFSITYQNKKINIKRLYCNIGWGQDLKLKCVNKKTNDFKIIHVGKSDINNIDINYDFETLYKSDNYIITLYENKFNDLFLIKFYEENKTIYIKRVDCAEGWGQQLMINILDVARNHNFTIYIGSSSSNEIYKKVDLIIRKCYVSLTTIPSRIILPSFITNVNKFLREQTYPIENMFIVVAKKYKRFKETISDEIINELKQINKVIIIMLDEDYGPASKYLGPLIHHNDIIKNNLLVIIDDDRTYNKNLVRNFSIAYNSYANPNITFSSGYWWEYFDKKYYMANNDSLKLEVYKETNDNKFFNGQGVGGFYGFCIKVSNIEKFIDYNIKIMEKLPLSIYHDEGIILGYLKYNKELLLYLRHRGCDIIKDELVDALCKSDLVDRKRIEKEILHVSNMLTL